MKKSRLFLLVAAFACVAFCGNLFAQSKNYNNTLTQENKTNRKVNTLKVIFTSDLHSCADRYGKLVSFINKEREKAAENGYEIITLDAGDMAMGSIYSAFYEIDATEYRMLAYAGYDAFVFGNHDFDLGLTSLAYMLYNSRIQDNDKNPTTGKSMVFPVNVTANIDGGDDQNFTNALKFIGHQRYFIFKKGNLRVAVFGLLGNNAYSISNVAGKMPFQDPIEVAKKLLPSIKAQKPDFIICLSHSGAALRDKSEDARLAKECPDIDLIISGHDHEALFKPYVVGNVPIVSAGSNGTVVGEADLFKSNSGVTLQDYELKAVPEDIEPDAGALFMANMLKMKVVDQFEKRYHSSPFEVMDTVKTQLSMFTDSTGFNPMAYDIAKAIFNCAYFLKEVPKDTSRLVSIVPKGVIRQNLPEGPVTYEDVFNTLSLGRDSRKNPGYPVILCYLTGKELKTICEYNVSAAPDNPDTYMTFYGMNYTYNPRMPKLFRVKDVYVHGKKVESSALYPVVTDLYTANCISLVDKKSYGFLSLTPKTKDGKEILDIERSCPLRGHAEGWFLDNADIAEWYAYALYLRDKVDVPDSYPVPAGKAEPSYTPFIIWGVAALALIAVVIFLIRSVKRRKK